MCSGDQKVGEFGCTYKLHEITRAINATCLYNTTNGIIYSYNTTCFDACPQPTNTTSDCYLKCFSETVIASSQE